MERHPYLKKLNDKALWKLICSISTEIKERIIGLLEEWGVTQFTFNGTADDYPSMTVWDYDKGNLDIYVMTIGYSIDRYGDREESGKHLYIVDKDNIVYWGDDAILNDTLWDVYHQMKDYIK